MSPRMNSYYYTVYGLILCSNRLLPELIPTQTPSAGIDPVIVSFEERSRNIPLPPPPNQSPYYVSPNKDTEGRPLVKAWCDDNYLFVFYLNGCHFVISRTGDTIKCIWPSKIDFGYVIAQLLGPILGSILQLRGILALHASAVVVRGRALVILGSHGSGKSTLAAEMNRQGCSVLSDDIAALTEYDNIWMVHPGYPRLRLWPTSAEAIYGPEHGLRRIAPGYDRWDKRYLDLGEGKRTFETQAQLLRAVYVLDWRDPPPDVIQVKPLLKREALVWLDALCYSQSNYDRRKRAQRLSNLERLLNSVQVRTVRPTADLATLPELSSAILNDFEDAVSRE